MPRTRSLKWSELKIGIMAVVAILIAASLILTLSGVAGMWWQRYHLKVFKINISDPERAALPPPTTAARKPQLSQPTCSFHDLSQFWLDGQKHLKGTQVVVV